MLPRLRAEATGHNPLVRTPRRYLEYFPSSPAGARGARSDVREFIAQWLRGPEATDFESAVGEALANVAEHAGATQMTVSCVVEADAMVVEICSDGPGFTPPGQVEPPAAGALRGYGLFIMRRMVDSVEFFDEGRGVRLVRRLR